MSRIQRMWLYIACVIVALVGVKYLYIAVRYPVVSEPAVIAIDPFSEPIQEPTSEDPFAMQDRKRRNVVLYPRASYDIQARVIINRGYPRYDVDRPVGDLLTNDLVLTWGELSQAKYFRHIDFSHQFMYVTFKYNSEMLVRELGHAYIKNHISSNHLVAKNANIHNALRRLKPYDIVHISGYLVDIQTEGEELVSTSLSREDNWSRSQGNRGGSEFIYVTQMQKGEEVFR